MLGIGMHILPWMGLPQLHLGAHPLAVIPVAVAIAFSATTYGYFIGSWFRTTNQALPFGAISVVILSAMGGIWIPVDILPKTVQHMAMCSPLYWALDGVNQLFLRNLGLASVSRHLLILTGISLVLWMLAYLKNTRRPASV
jgi:ABC-2 type transport system permease protein